MKIAEVAAVGVVAAVFVAAEFVEVAFAVEAELVDDDDVFVEVMAVVSVDADRERNEDALGLYCVPI